MLEQPRPDAGLAGNVTGAFRFCSEVEELLGGGLARVQGAAARRGEVGEPARRLPLRRPVPARGRVGQRRPAAQARRTTACASSSSRTGRSSSCCSSARSRTACALTKRPEKEATLATMRYVIGRLVKAVRAEHPWVFWNEVRDVDRESRRLVAPYPFGETIPTVGGALLTLAHAADRRRRLGGAARVRAGPDRRSAASARGRPPGAVRLQRRRPDRRGAPGRLRLAAPQPARPARRGASPPRRERLAPPAPTVRTREERPVAEYLKKATPPAPAGPAGRARHGDARSCERVQRRGPRGRARTTRAASTAGTRRRSGSRDERDRGGARQARARTCWPRSSSRTTRCEHFAELQRASMLEFEEETRPGVFLGQKHIPVGSVGAYVPSGKYPMLMSAQMSILTAKVAGVPRVVGCAPPYGGTGIYPEVLVVDAPAPAPTRSGRWAACRRSPCSPSASRGSTPVDLIAGPGNMYVAEAKRQLFGTVGIDLLAGPTEILDHRRRGGRPAWSSAADLLGQAEHGPTSPAVLVHHLRGRWPRRCSPRSTASCRCCRRPRSSARRGAQLGEVVVARRRATRPAAARRPLRAGAPRGADRRPGLVRRPPEQLRHAVRRRGGDDRLQRQGHRHQPHAADGRGRPLHGRPLGRQVPQDGDLPALHAGGRAGHRAARRAAQRRRSSCRATPSRPACAWRSTGADEAVSPSSTG